MSLSNEELLGILKANIAVTGTPGGIASPQDSTEFIDLSRDQTYVLQHLRVETGIRTSFNLDSLNLNEPVIIGATEGQAPADADVIAVGRNRKTLQPKEVIAAFDPTFDFLRKNIKGRSVEQDLNNIFAKRFGKDVVLAAFSGDTTIVGTTRMDKAKKWNDGYIKRALADATVHDYVIPVSPSYVSAVFPQMLGQLPKDYRDERDMLRFFVSADVYDAYATEIGNRATSAGDLLLLGPWKEALTYMGIKIVPVYGLDTDTIILTIGENLAVGFGREITVGKDIDNRARVMKVTLTADVDFNYVEGDAIVLGQTA